jgi:hypothetical protein
MSFFKNRGQEGKTGPVWGLTPMGGGEHKERVWEVNMVNIMHSCIKWKNETC